MDILPMWVFDPFWEPGDPEFRPGDRVKCNKTGRKGTIQPCPPANDHMYMQVVQ